MNIEKARKELLQTLIRKSFKYNDQPIFKLASGKLSNYYINCKATTLDPASMLLIGHIFYDKIKNLDVDAVGGLTHGADPIALATSMVSGMQGNSIQAFVIRKEPKAHGMMKLIEGNVEKGSRVVIVDDVVTTGGSTIQAIEKAKEEGLIIKKAIVLINRQEGGRENIEEKGIPFESVFTKDELIRAYKG